MKGWRPYSAVAQAQRVKNGLSRETVHQAVHARLSAIEADIKAFLCLPGEPLPGSDAHSAHPLSGAAVAVKDVLCTVGAPTTCGSKILSGYQSPFDATVVRRLKAAGLQLMGKTNMDEFAMGSSTENSAYFPSHNPWDTARVPGGSSGGSSAVVGSGAVPLAIGTDTGGSIRQPAAFCGLVGLKPTYGRVSRYGLVAFASSLDQAGPMTVTVRDNALLMGVMAGHDPLDSTSVNTPVPDYAASLDKGVAGLRFGWVKEYLGEGLDPEIRANLEDMRVKLEQAGAVFVDVELPHTPHTLPCYYIIAPSEASSNLARYDGIRYGHRTKDAKAMVDLYVQSRTEGFGPEVKRRIMLGTYTLSSGYYDAYYVQAMKVRAKIREDFDKVFEKVDLLIGPTTPTTAFKLGEKTSDPLAMYLSDIYTVGASLAGIPALSLPTGFDGAGLPIGLQLIGRSFEEALLLQAAQFLEDAAALEQKPALASKWMNLPTEKELVS